MNTKRRQTVGAIMAVLSCAAMGIAQSPGEVVALVGANGPGLRYVPSAVSGDSRVVYGAYDLAGYRSFRWRSTEGITPFPPLSRFGVSGLFTSTSYDGRNFVTTATYGDEEQTESRVLLMSGVDGSIIANLTGSHELTRDAFSRTMSRDGSIVLGRGRNHDPDGTRAHYPIVWRGLEDPFVLSSPDIAIGEHISADARVIGGTARVDGRDRATLWRNFGQPTFLPEYPGAEDAGVSGLSADGSIVSQVVYFGPSLLDVVSVLWSEAGGFEAITDPIYGLTSIELLHLTPDARYMYGVARSTEGVDVAVLWERGRGVLPPRCAGLSTHWAILRAPGDSDPQ